MASSAEDFHSDMWRLALRAYASGLLKLLSGDLSRFSGTGVPLKQANRWMLLIQEAESDSNLRAVKREGRASHDNFQGPIGPAARDLDFLRYWSRKNNAEPLLILAPFGSGKSILLSAFTCQLAQEVVDWCDKDDRQRRLPAVPFPVRLRGWARDKYKNLTRYVCEASQELIDPNIESPLTQEQICRLASEGALLPLYDGLDELPADDGFRDIAVKAMKSLTSRFVLSARPGHGAEAMFALGHQYSVGELTAEEAELFVRRQLCIPEDQHDHPDLAAYRMAQPYVNELFRRPLFINAWCNEDKENRPITLSELMNVVLKKVFDDRVFKRGLYVPVQSANEVVLSRHKLGALLSAYAEIGYGVPGSLMEKPIDDAITESGCFSKKSQAAQWNELAVRAGLLISNGDTYYTVKIPVVEYLIGSYYAWLGLAPVRSLVEEESKRRQRLLIAKFRRGFWWLEFEEIWRFTFDQLWRGSARQLELAEAIVDWLLLFSKLCLAAGQYTGDLLPGQSQEDRGAFTCHRFVIRILLPVGAIPFAIQTKVKLRLTTALDQMFEDLTLSFRHLSWSDANLKVLPEEVLGEVVRRLEKLFNDSSYSDIRVQLMRSLADVAARLDRFEAYRLVDGTLELVLRDAKDPNLRESTLRAISAAAGRVHGKDAGKILADILLPRLCDVGQCEDWTWIGIAIEKSVSRLDTKAAGDLLNGTLLNFATSRTYRSRKWHIVPAMGAAIKKLPSADALVVLKQVLILLLKDPWDKWAMWCMSHILYDAVYLLDDADAAHLILEALVPALMNARCLESSWFIAAAIGKGAKRLNAAQASEAQRKLLKCLTDIRYKHAWEAIGTGIAALAKYADAPNPAILCDELINYINDYNYISAWWSLAEAIGTICGENVGMQARNDTIKKLLSSLGDKGMKDLWAEISNAIYKCATDLTTAQVCLVIDQLLPFVRNPDYGERLNEIADILGVLAGRLDSSIKVWSVIQVIGSCLTDENFKEHHISLADAICPASPQLARAKSLELLKELTPLLITSTGNFELLICLCEAISVTGHSMSHEHARLLDQQFCRPGRIRVVQRMLRNAPRLHSFVRGVTAGATPNHIEWGVCERNDAHLLVDPKLQCTPNQIRDLCEDQPFESYNYSESGNKRHASVAKMKGQKVSDQADATSKSNGGQGLSNLSRAIAVLAEHPDWNDRQVAKAANCPQSTMSSSKRYKMLRNAFRMMGKPKRGILNNGVVDGIVDSEDEE